jgi:hypothetical protein
MAEQRASDTAGPMSRWSGLVALAVLGAGCSASSAVDRSTAGISPDGSDDTHVSDAARPGSDSSIDANSSDGALDGGPDGTVEAGASDGSEDTGFDVLTDAAAGNEDGSIPPAGYPILTNNGGAMTPTQVPIYVITILAQNDTALSSLQAFSAALPSSTWWSWVSGTYALGTPKHAELVGASIPAGPVTDAWMIQYIRQTLAQNGWTLGTGQYHGNTINVLYLPDGVTTPDNDSMCSNRLGYHQHDYITPDNDFIWAVVQRCPPVLLPNAVQNAMVTGSHEIAEAATDPLPPNGYMLSSVSNETKAPPPAWDYSPFAYAPPDGEVGDLCAGTFETEGAFTYQRIWSNLAAVEQDPCVPPSTVPYESVTTPRSWYAVQPGSSVAIPVTGWSTSSTAQSWTSFAWMTVSEPASSTFSVNGSAFVMNNSGNPGMVYPSAASTAASGDYGALEIISYTSPSSEQHVWSVGVYVP